MAQVREVVRHGQGCRSVVGRDDEHPTAQRARDAEDHGIRARDVRQVLAGDAGAPTARARRERDDVEVAVEHGTHLGAPAEVGADAQPRQACGRPVDPVSVRRIGAQLSGDGEPSAELRLRLPQLDLVTAFGGVRGQLHPGRAAADHQQPHRLVGCRHGREGLAPGVRVDAAAERQPFERVAVDAVVEGDARTHLVGAAVEGLAEPLTVRDEGAHHAHHVGIAVGDDLLGRLRMHDPAHVEDGQARGGLGLAAHRGPGRLGVHPVLQVGDRAPVAADVEVEVVDGAVSLEALHEAHALVEAVAAVHVLVEGQSKAEGDRPVDACADAVGDLPQEASTVLVRAAVLVRAGVGQRGEEPLDDVVVVGVQLERVKARARGDHRRLDVLVDDPLHLLVAHDVHAAVVEEAGEGGGGRAGHAALLQQLDPHVAAGSMDPLDEVRHAVVEQRVPEVAVALAHRPDARGLEPGDMQVPDVAGGSPDPREAVLHAGEPVVDHGLEPGVVAGERARAAAVRRHEETVGQAHGADGDRLERGSQRSAGGDGHGKLWHGVTGAGEKKRGIRLDEFPVPSVRVVPRVARSRG